MMTGVHGKGIEEPCLVQGGPPAVGRQELVRRIREYLVDTAVEKAILFGSFARAKLLPDAPELADLQDRAADLDLFYIPTRYPNGLVEGTPHTAFTRAQADRALEGAGQVLVAVRAAIARIAP